VAHMKKRRKQSKDLSNPGQLEFCWGDEFMTGAKVSSKTAVIPEENGSQIDDVNQEEEL